ncbi:MAG: hypothetical protein CMH64_01340 [Nanoarchaeota archaeon]|nr:hypothetical protein [Nanoarchaeota archaeon]|tara:strand:- start:1777 stop:1980 length:204 start_codon:yes stop_codon:yes gene_type:complete
MIKWGMTQEERDIAIIIERAERLRFDGLGVNENFYDSALGEIDTKLSAYRGSRRDRFERIYADLMLS